MFRKMFRKTFTKIEITRENPNTPQKQQKLLTTKPSPTKSSSGRPKVGGDEPTAGRFSSIFTSITISIRTAITIKNSYNNKEHL